MKEINFKIIELPGHQVLIQKDFDNENDEYSYLLVVTFYLDGVKISNSYAYDDVQDVNSLFDSINAEYVQPIVDGAISMFS